MSKTICYELYCRLSDEYGKKWIYYTRETSVKAIKKSIVSFKKHNPYWDWKVYKITTDLFLEGK